MKKRRGARRNFLGRVREKASSQGKPEQGGHELGGHEGRPYYGTSMCLGRAGVVGEQQGKLKGRNYGMPMGMRDAASWARSRGTRTMDG